VKFQIAFNQQRVSDTLAEVIGIVARIIKPLGFLSTYEK
jgi:hypothetical protein